MNYYEALRASLLSFAADFVEEIVSTAPGIQLIDFDTFADPSTLPETDLFGPFQFDMTDEGGLITARTMFMASTLNDLNLFRLNKIVGAAYWKLRPDLSLPFVDPDNGDTRGVLKIQAGTSVLPLDYSTVRPMKGIAVSLASSEAAH